MDNPQVGDIVTVASKSVLRRHVIIEQVPTAWPPGERWKVRYSESDIDYVAGAGDLTLVLRPTIVPGTVLMHDGHEVTVVSFQMPHVTILLPAAARTEDLQDIRHSMLPLSRVPSGRFDWGHGFLPLCAKKERRPKADALPMRAV